MTNRDAVQELVCCAIFGVLIALFGFGLTLAAGGNVSQLVGMTIVFGVAGFLVGVRGLPIK
jgi:hypothetical protein